MKFNKIVSVDNTGLQKWVKEELLEIANEVVFYDDFPKDNNEIISRISNADCVLVSWNTTIDKEVINACNNIKYIGMCCSLYDEKSANVDIDSAKDKGITVVGVRDYGDEGLVEFIISELIKLLHGFDKHQWKKEVLELTYQKLGIIGLGTTGKMLAKAAQLFGMDVYYYNRSRKIDLEEEGIKYLEIDDLLRKVDIVSTHLPRNTVILDEKEFKVFGNNKIMINTSLEPTFGMPAFKRWIVKEGNYSILDKAGMGVYYDDLKGYENVIYTEKVSGWTHQAQERLSKKALTNMLDYLQRK